MSGAKSATAFLALGLVALASCATPTAPDPGWSNGDTCLVRVAGQCRCWLGDYLTGYGCPRTCNRAELSAARDAYRAPWVLGKSLASERDAAWLRWFRAAEACGVDWRMDARLRALPMGVTSALTTEPWFSIACGPWPDDWSECRELKQRRSAR